MGAWFWTDVEHDAASAVEASDQLEHLADRLQDIAESLARTATTARVDWNGTARTVFDDLFDHLLSQCHGLVEALRRAAASVRDSLDSALDDQHRRMRLREEYLRERAAHADGRWVA